MQPIVTQPRWLGRRIAESEYLWFNLNVKLNLPFECNLISWWNWISFINKWALGDIKSLNVGFHIPVQCLNLLICYCLFCKRSTVGGKIWIIGFQYWSQHQIALLLYLSSTKYNIHTIHKELCIAFWILHKLIGNPVHICIVFSTCYNVCKQKT